MTSTDLSRAALETATRNFAHNATNPKVARCRHTTIAGDAFEVLGELRKQRRTFDLVVIDPPSFAMRASAVERATKAYAALTRLGLSVLEHKGVLVQSSCSSRVGPDLLRDTIERSASSAGVPVQLLEATGHALDHPIGFSEGEYLSTFVYRKL
ncbi:MAG: class I SAM-dependent methyltransferase [Ilumatobacteraceae bacterium]